MNPDRRKNTLQCKSKYLIKGISVTVPDWQRGKSEKERSCLSWFESRFEQHRLLPALLCLALESPVGFAWGHNRCCVCPSGWDHACPGWCLRHRSLAACTANETGLEAHIAKQRAQTSHRPLLRAGGGTSGSRSCSISFNLPVKRHLKDLPANLEKFSLQGTDIQSEDNGSFAAKRWSECPACVIVTLLSIPWVPYWVQGRGWVLGEQG